MVDSRTTAHTATHATTHTHDRVRMVFPLSSSSLPTLAPPRLGRPQQPINTYINLLTSSIPTLALLAFAANERSSLVPLPDLGKADVNCS